MSAEAGEQTGTVDGCGVPGWGASAGLYPRHLNELRL